MGERSYTDRRDISISVLRAEHTSIQIGKKVIGIAVSLIPSYF